MNRLQVELDYADAVSDWFLELGDHHRANREFNVAAKNYHVAASILSWQNRTLSSPRLESSLRAIASQIPISSFGTNESIPKSDQRDVCLHVMSHALPAGGITSMVLRWITSDTSRIHCLALLENDLPIPEDLERSVISSGGKIYVADSGASMLEKAAWLRSLSRLMANYVILHINPDDVIYVIAFGTKGGPPVCLVNYTAHSFWIGGSVADLVLNVRGSSLEEFWTERYRGITRYSTLPITLPDMCAIDPLTTSNDQSRLARKTIGIPENCVAILTVGASFKYLPTETMDCLLTYEDILHQLPEAYLLVVGFRGDDRWENASRRTGSRIRTFGVVAPASLATIHQASDIYIEGFPFGTTTALLEAGAKGIPVVLAPAQCPPPYGSDGKALDGTLQRPASPQDYAQNIVRWAQNPGERIREGRRIGAAIRKHHTGTGWAKYLEGALAKLPAEHAPAPLSEPIRTPSNIHEYWSEFTGSISEGPVAACESAVSRALSLNLKPQLTRQAREIFRKYKSIRSHRTIPIPILLVFCNFLVRILPVTWARGIFRLLSFLYRPLLLKRLKLRLSQQLLGRQRRPGMYEEYRKPVSS